MMQSHSTETKPMKKRPLKRNPFAESTPGLLNKYYRSNGEKKHRFVPVQQVAEQLGKHPRTIRNWCDWGWLEWVRVGSHRLIDQDSLDDRRSTAGEE